MLKKRVNLKEVTCDQGCRRGIKVSDIRLEEEEEEQIGKSVFYFKCPYCGQRYDSYVKDSKGNIKGIGGNE